MQIEIEAADGHSLACWSVSATGERVGGLVILQEIFGVTDQLKGVAQRYAALGYDVLVPALFDRAERGTIVPFSDAPRGRDIMLSCDLDQTMLDVDAAVRHLKAAGLPVAVLGFCWGGALAIRSAQILEIAAAVSVYGTRLPHYQIAPIKVPVQGHWGDADGHVPEPMLDAARAFWPEMEVHVYEGAGHAFANDARPQDYMPEATEMVHARASAFLAKNM